MKSILEQFSNGYINETDNFPNLSPTQSTLIVSILIAGTVFRSLLAAPVNDKLGNRMFLIIAMAVFAFRVLLQTSATIIEELAGIKANHQYELSLDLSTYCEVFVGSPHLDRRLLRASGLQMLQLLSGCNFILYYGTSFFQNIGSQFVIALVINIVNMVPTVPSMFLVEVLGRSRLLMIGATGMTFAQLIIASVGTALPMAQVPHLVLMVFVCIFHFFFAAPWGPVVWVVTSEIYPLKVRAKSMSISVASNWIPNFAMAYGTNIRLPKSET